MREREGYRELKVAERVSFHREKERKTSDNFSKSNTTRAAQVANQGRRMQREREREENKETERSSERRKNLRRIHVVSSCVASMCY